MTKKKLISDKKNKKVLNMLNAQYKRIEKKLNSKTQTKIDELLAVFLLNKPIDLWTLDRIREKLKACFGDAFKEIILSCLLNDFDLLQTLKIKPEHKKFFLKLHDKYYLLISDAKIRMSMPERWELVNTKLHESKELGGYFKTRIVRYDNTTFSFEAYGQDIVVLIEHFLKQLKQIRAEPQKPFQDKIKSFIQDLNEILQMSKDVKNPMKKKK